MIVRIPFILILLICSVAACRQSQVDNAYAYQIPAYDSLVINKSEDTVHLPLPDNFYNQIKSFNFFEDAGVGYLSLYDSRSRTAVVFNFESKSVVFRFSMDKIFNKDDVYKSSMVIKNFDTIVIANKNSVIIVDSAGRKKFSCLLPNDGFAFLDNSRPPIFDGNRLIVSAQLKNRETDLESIREQQLFYELNLTNGEVQMKYRFPDYFSRDYYGQRMMYLSFCANKENKLVLSFRADSLLYETDLSKINHSFFARSRFQRVPITPMKKNMIDNDLGAREFRTRQSYGAIYYDRVRDLYLRATQTAMSEEDYQKAGRRRVQSLMVLNGRFRVIGEKTLDSTLYADFLFFDNKGKLYSRFHASDEYAIHFIQLKYNDLSKDLKLVAR